MKQQTLAVAADAAAGFEQYRRATKRDVFLTTMNEIVPWQPLCAVIEPHYPKAGNGRPPVGLRTAGAVYLVETKGQEQTIHPNVQRKLKAALAWCDRINNLSEEQRGGPPWALRHSVWNLT